MYVIALSPTRYYAGTDLKGAHLFLPLPAARRYWFRFRARRVAAHLREPAAQVVRVREARKVADKHKK